MAKEKAEKVEETKEQQDYSKIQAVKELIFGPDIQTFEDQFKALNDRLDDLQNQLIDVPIEPFYLHQVVLVKLVLMIVEQCEY